MHHSPIFTQRVRRAAVLAGIVGVATIAACKNPAGSPEGVVTNPLAATYDSALGIVIGNFQVTTNGAYTFDSIIGGGAVANAGKLVRLRYTGYLTNGIVFDKNTNVVTDSLLTFTIGSRSVIQGFDEGLIGMRQGGKRMIIIPPKLGYGNVAHAGIPANAILVFSISLNTVQ